MNPRTHETMNTTTPPPALPGPQPFGAAGRASRLIPRWLRGLLVVLAVAAVVPLAGERPAAAVDDVATVLESSITTCVDDPTTVDADTPLLSDGCTPLPMPSSGIDVAPTVQPAYGSGSTTLQRLCNGHVASLDTGAVRLAYSVNPDPDQDDPEDTSPPPLDEVVMVATVSNARWVSSLPGFCGAGSGVSGDGTVLTCRIVGPVQSGSVTGFVATYLADSAANGTPINVDLTTNGTQSDPPGGSVLQDPAPDAAEPVGVVIDSRDVPLDVRKGTQTGFTTRYSRIDANADGVPEFAEITWSVGLGPDFLEADALLGAGGKGLAPTTLDGFVVGDDPSDGGRWDGAQLVSCTNGWVCTQPGGPGSAITARPPDGTYEIPGDCPSPTSTTLWCYGEQPTTTSDRWRDFTDTVLRVRYPWADLVAVDGTPGDTNPDAGEVDVCNVAPPEDATEDNQTDDNRHCLEVRTGSNPGARWQASKFMTGGGSGGSDHLGNPNTWLDVLGGDGHHPAFGNDELAHEDLAVAGQAFYSVVEMANLAQSTTTFPGTGQPVLCDVFDTQRYVLTTMTGQSADSVRSHAAVSTHPASAGVPASAVVVEFTAGGPAYVPSAPGSNGGLDCGDESLGWTTDPTTLPGGAAAATAMRVRLTQDLPTGARIRVAARLRLPADVPNGTIFTDYLRYNDPIGGWTPPPDLDLETHDDFGGQGPARGAAGAVFDRGVVIDGVLKTGIDDRGQVPSSMYPANIGSGGASLDGTTTLAPGATWPLDVRWSFDTAAARVGDQLEGLRQYVVLPPGLTFAGADVAPTRIIQDCLPVGGDCVDGGAPADDVGYTVLEWDVGNVPITAAHLTDLVELDVVVSNLLGNSACRRPLAFVVRGDEPAVVDPGGVQDLVTCSTTNEMTDGFYGHHDRTTLQIGTTAQTGVDKTVLDPWIGLDDELTHRLGFYQDAGGTRDVDVIDVFPYPGDGRAINDLEGSTSPSSSDFSGTLELLDVAVVQGDHVDADDIWVSASDPADLRRDPANAQTAGQTLGSASWPCTLAEVQAGAPASCPEMAEITALRFAIGRSGTAGDGLPSGAVQLVDLRFRTDGNEPGDVYTNNARMRVENLGNLFAQSPNATTRVFCGGAGDLVFIDHDGDGRYTDGVDEPVEGIEVEVLSVGADGAPGGGDDVVGGSSVTHADGRWHVSCLDEGTFYARIAQSELADLGLRAASGAQQAADGADEDVDHNALPAGGGVRTSTFTLSLGGAPVGEPDPSGFLGATQPVLRDQDVDQTIDLALAPPASIAGRVFFDVDADGTLDGGEPGIGGVSMRLVGVDVDGFEVELESVTDGQGRWSFEGLAPGTYRVEETQPAGWADGEETVGSHGGELVANDVIGEVELAGGDEATGYDFGELASGSLGDRVWVDRDDDGVQDAGEPGVEGVEVSVLWAGLDGEFGTDDDQEWSDVTAADGIWGVSGLPEGSYRVSIGAVPAGLELGFDLDGGRDGTADLELGLGEDRDDADFGLVPTQINLAITKGVATASSGGRPVDPDELPEGSRVTYEIVAVNEGPLTAPPGVVVEDDLPGGLEYVDHEVSAGWRCEVGDTVRCRSLEPMHPGDRMRLRLTVDVLADGGSRIRNVSEVRAPDGTTETTLEDNVDDAEIAVVDDTTAVWPQPPIDIPRLPRTGAAIALLVQVGTALVLVGGALVRSARRRGERR